MCRQAGTRLMWMTGIGMCTTPYHMRGTCKGMMPCEKCCKISVFQSMSSQTGTESTQKYACACWASQIAFRYSSLSSLLYFPRTVLLHQLVLTWRYHCSDWSPVVPSLHGEYPHIGCPDKEMTVAKAGTLADNPATIDIVKLQMHDLYLRLQSAHL